MPKEDLGTIGPGVKVLRDFPMAISEHSRIEGQRELYTAGDMKHRKQQKTASSAAMRSIPEAEVVTARN